MTRHPLPTPGRWDLAGLLVWAALFAPPAIGALVPPPSGEELNNLAYRGITDRPIQLKDGVCDGAPATTAGTPQPHVQLLQGSRVTGDLNADRVDDAAVLLAASTAGGGETLYVAVVLGDDDEADIRNVATQPLGSRIKVRTLRIDQGKLVLDLVKAGPGDAACCPSLKVRTSYRLQDEALVENGREEQGRLSVADLPGTTWNLVRLGSRPLPSGVAVTIEFEGDQIMGNAGCNRYFAGIKGNGPYDLSIGPPGATRRACPEPAMAVESAYLQALQKVTQFSFLGGRLVLSYPMGDNQPAESLVFSADK